MQQILNFLSGFVGLLCRLFGVTPESIKAEKDRNPSAARPE